MRTKKILLIILLLAIGFSMLYIDPASYVNRFIYFISFGFALFIPFYKREKFPVGDIFRDKIYGLLWIIFIISGILGAFLVLKERDNVYTYLSFALFACSFIGLVIRNIMIMGASHKTKSHD